MRIKGGAVLFAAAAALVPITGEAQQTPAPLPAFTGDVARAVDDLARGEIRGRSTPGLTIAIVKDGLLVYAHGFGLANASRGRGVSAGTQFYTGSLMEQFTAASILLLARDKQLALTDKVTKYVPELTVARNVTIEELLHQTSGLPDPLRAPTGAQDLTRPVRLPDLIREADALPAASPPGTHFAYNGLNYALLGLVAQRASGLPLSVYFQTHIFQPLIMTSSFLAGDQGISPSHAVGYTRTGGRFVPAKMWDPSWLFGASDLVTNAYDLAKWDVGLPLILDVDAVRSMWSPGNAPEDTPYGMGWVIDQRGGQRYLWQSGTIAGYHAMNALLPDEHIAVIVLANADSLHEPAIEPERVAGRLLDIVAPLPPARFGSTITQRASEWLGRLSHVDIDRTQLTAAYSQYLTDRVAQQAELKSLGTLLSLVPVESYARQTDTVYVFDVTFEHGHYRYQFVLTPEGKIDGLLLQP